MTQKIIASFIRYAVIGCILAPSWGCSHLPSLTFHPKNFSVKTVAGTPVVQNENTAQPTKVDTVKDETTYTIPKNTEINFDEKLGTIKMRLTDAMPVLVNHIQEKIQAPTPTKPPSEADHAQAQGVRWFWLVSIVCAVAGAVACYLGHVKAGCFLFVGSLGFPLVAQIISLALANVVLALCVASAVAMIYAWYSLRKSHPEYLAELKTKAEAVEMEIAKKMKVIPSNDTPNKPVVPA